ncbi:MAG: polyketide synthase dehydratase domain-containing protein, partial [Anaerolineae bacterium]|nr:polyketide synthase dehydratase domain-containing protein [Anaerolineae bacterium]
MSNPTNNQALSPIKRALRAVEKMQARLEAIEYAQREPIAIVGIGCRFPGGVNTPEQFWQLLRDGTDVITEVPRERWDVEAYYDPNPDAPGKMHTRYGGFLSQVDSFDAPFFGISSREAMSLDPQQRLLLEVSWEALERANLVPTDPINSATGVFVGICTNDYRELLNGNKLNRQHDLYGATGNANSVATGRLSYILGLMGPSIAVDTACSSSLVAVHLACQSLRQGECDVALAGGVNAMLTPDVTIAFSTARMLAPDGRCKTFDAAANGYVRGEGCGMVVLKRLSDAQADHDNILAVIRGSMVNQDGRSSGLTAPSGLSQRAVISKALQNSRLASEQVRYIEAHGTGTSLGDPIEIGALNDVFGQRTEPLWVGSVKTNMGHLESAAGIAGLIKVALSLKYGEIPPHLHFQNPNPYIDWDQSPVQIPTDVTPWPAGRRIAGVSAFGFSGTNAHVVLEEAPPLPAKAEVSERPYHLLTLSAKSAPALSELIRRYQAYLKSRPETSWNAICHTANTGRTHFAHRLAVTAASVRQVQEKLSGYLDEQAPLKAGYVSDHQTAPKIAFLFTGQGSQYVNMGRELYETQPTFRRALEQCAEILRPYYPGQSLLELLYPQRSEPSGADSSSPLNQTANSQPALFALEYALAKLWQSWGITPDIVLGHSVGEYAAACVAGILSLGDALKLVAERGRLMQALPRPGAMLAEFEQVAQAINYTEPKIPLVSNVTGAVATEEITRPNYWIRHVQETVRFAASMGTLHQQGVDLFLEIGPQPILLGMSRQCLPEQNLTDGQSKIENRKSKIDWLPSLRPERSDWQQMLESLGQIYMRGVRIDWAGFDQDDSSHKVVLPTYPFQRQRYWVNTSSVKQQNREQLRPLLDRMVRSPLHKAMIFETTFNSETLPFLADHRVYDQLMAPGGCHIALILSGVEVAYETQTCHLEDVVLPQGLVIPPDGSRTVQLVFTPDEDAQSDHPTVSFQLISFEVGDTGIDDPPATHARGRIVIKDDAEPAFVSLDELQTRCRVEIPSRELYAAAEKQQVVLGPSFRWLTTIRRGADEAIARVQAPDVVGELAGYLMHPGLVDACFQLAGVARSDSDSDESLLPFAVESLRLFQPVTGREWWAYARRVGDRQWNVQLLDVIGRVVVDIIGFEMRPAGPVSTSFAEPWRDWLYTVTWRPQLQFGLPPDYLPQPEQLSEPLALQFESALWQTDFESFAAIQHSLEAVSIDYTLGALTRLGIVFRVGAYLSTEQIARQAGVMPQYRRLLARLLEMLAEVGILKPEAGGWQVIRVPEYRDPGQQLVELQQQYSTVAEAELTLLSRCGPKLSEVLRGEQAPLELLFPGGDAGTAAKLSGESISAVVMNRLVAQAVQAAVERLPVERGLRVLEVGAGTGSTTAYVLPHLPADRTEYLFTDIGPTFLTQARERFKAFDFIDYKMLDIEQNPLDQGLAAHQYDIVIAANVLHATRNLNHTLAHIQHLLSPGGILVLLEGTTQARWVDLTFGLTEGWWRFDDDVRHNHPLLTGNQWQTVLLDNGFQSVIVLPQDASATSLGQAVIIAQAEEVRKLTKRPWLLLSDADGIGQALAASLRACGEEPILVYPTGNYEQFDAHTFAINPDRVADFERVLQAAPHLHGVVHLWGLADPPAVALGDLEIASKRSCGSVLHLVQALLKTESRPPALWVVTQGAQAVVKDEAVPGVARSSLWGMVRVIGLEHPELNCVHFDLDPQAPAAIQAKVLATELMSQPHAVRPEDQL